MKVLALCAVVCMSPLICKSQKIVHPRRATDSTAIRYSAENSRQVPYKSEPYRFGYSIKNKDGDTLWHKEDSDDKGSKKGSYGYTDARGLYRHVEYVADHRGFRASIKSNEPGISHANPSNVLMSADSSHPGSFAFETGHSPSPRSLQKPKYAYIPLYVRRIN